ncbi:MAG: hypothetical protein OXQ90_19220 [Gammaproteobacteria bacterium]|nr:hypothetical protein [Gammaproteobacteria bacterium]
MSVEPVSDSQERLVDRALYRAAAQYRLAERVDIYPAVAVAVAAARRGATASEIKDEVAKAQYILWGRGDLGEATLAAAQRLADGSDVLGAVAAAARGDAVHWTAAVAHTGTSGSVSNARQQILEHYDEAYQVHGDVLREWRIPEEVVGVSPAASREDVAAVLPAPLAREMLVLADAGNPARIQAVREKTGALWKELEGLRDLSAAELGQGLAEYLDKTREQERTAEQDADRATRVDGIKSLVYLGSELVGIGSPKAGAKLKTIGNTLVSLHESWTNFKDTSNGLKGLTKGLAVATLTADFVSAAITLVELFIDTGPTIDEVILENIVSLRREIEESRLQMHARFDFVDHRLDRIHVDLASRLDALAGDVVGVWEDIHRIATDIAIELESQRDVIHDIFQASVGMEADILKGIGHASVGRCLRRKVMTESEFDSCLAQIRAQALDGTLERQQLALPGSTFGLRTALDQRPSAFVNAVGVAFAARLPAAAAPGICVPGADPAAFLDLLRLHERFVEEWPEYARLAAGDDGGFADAMRDNRDCILQFARGVAGDLVAFADAAGADRTETVVGSLIAEVRARADDVEAAIRQAARDNRREWQRTDGLDWRTPADRWQTVPRKRREAMLVRKDTYCEPEDWKYINKGAEYTSSLAYYIAPADAADLEERYQYLNEELRHALRTYLPAPIQSMSALHMGHLRVCAIGSIRQHGVTLAEPPAPGDRGNTARYVAEVHAKAVIAVRWVGRCDEPFEAEFYDHGRSRARFEFTVEHGRSWRDPFVRIVPDDRVPVVKGSLSPRPMRVVRVAEPVSGKIRVHPSTGGANQRLAMLQAFGRAIVGVRDSMRDWQGKADRACRQEFIDRFARKRDARLAIVGWTPGVQRAVADYDETVVRANLFVSAWIRLAMQEAIRRSDLLSGIASRAIRLPLWGDARASAKRPLDHLLNQHERLEDLTMLYERVIGSDEVRELAASELPGYPGISRVVFDSLDAGHPTVVARRAAIEGLPPHPSRASVTAASGPP